ncbi:hypothetical protein FQN50_003305 [Emmonsiellopsis sp. PD_5]|nr:hypothetical protein FQN50_003305 [Emmonsiellopsis sp. PD_5]
MRGSGSEILFKYSSTSQLYSYVGYLLTGIGNSPYINGLSYADGRVHVSGTYRNFVDYEGVNDPSSTKHKANDGPNGPKNNYGVKVRMESLHFTIPRGMLRRSWEEEILGSKVDGEKRVEVEAGR